MTTQIRFGFDGRNERAQRAASEYGAAAITRIKNKDREAVRNLVARAINEGTPPRELAGMLRSIVGLDPRRAAALLNFRQELVKGGLRGTDLKKTTQRYADKLVKQRALAIARTETMSALNAGTMAGLRQAREKGWIENEATKKIIVTPDERLCPICGSVEELVVPLDENVLGVDAPPFHPLCRCTIAIGSRHRRRNFSAAVSGNNPNFSSASIGKDERELIKSIYSLSRDLNGQYKNVRIADVSTKFDLLGAEKLTAEQLTKIRKALEALKNVEVEAKDISITLKLKSGKDQVNTYAWTLQSAPNEVFINLDGKLWLNIERNLLNDFRTGFHPGSLPRSILQHEIGHIRHGQGRTWINVFSREVGPSSWKSSNAFSHLIRAEDKQIAQSISATLGSRGNQNWDLLARQVSKYAAASPTEFIAEVYSGLAEGLTYSDEVMQAYRALGGPNVVFRVSPVSVPIPAPIPAPVPVPAPAPAPVPVHAPVPVPVSAPLLDSASKQLVDEINASIARLRDERRVKNIVIEPGKKRLSATERRELFSARNLELPTNSSDLVKLRNMLNSVERAASEFVDMRDITIIAQSDYTKEKIVDTAYAWGESKRKNIVLNLKPSNWENIARFKEADFRSGFHPVSDVASTLVHETAHIRHLTRSVTSVIDYSYKSWAPEVKEFVYRGLYDVEKKTALEIRDFLNTKSQDEWRMIAGRVSRYAKQNAAEFVAETFTGLRFGLVYDDEVMALYRGLHGPDWTVKLRKAKKVIPTTPPVSLVPPVPPVVVLPPPPLPPPPPPTPTPTPTPTPVAFGKTTAEEIARVLELRRNGLSYEAIEKELGWKAAHGSRVYGIVKKYAKPVVSNPIPAPISVTIPKPVVVPKPVAGTIEKAGKATAEEIARVIELRRNGLSYEAIERELGWKAQNGSRVWRIIKKYGGG